MHNSIHPYVITHIHTYTHTKLHTNIHAHILTYIHITRIQRTITSGEGKAGQPISSNKFLIFVNNEKQSAIKNWEIPEHYSCSYHNLITFNVNVANNKAKIYISLGTRYIIKWQHNEFHKNLLQVISKVFKLITTRETLKI
jgi:hypothetical protein